jgi:hypothetical protein
LYDRSTTRTKCFIGQETAPREFFDIIAAQKIALCNDVPLGFDAEECAALAHRLRLAGRTATELARITGGEEQARGWFERSYAGFAASQDVAGMRIAAASVVIAFIIEYGDIRTLDTWLRRHVDAGGELPIEHGCAHEATLCMAVTCAALNAGSYPATVDSSAVVYRLQVLLDDASAWLTRDHAVETARLLVDHARVFGNREQAQNMVLAMRRHTDDASAGALQRGRWYLSAADAYLADGKRDTAERYMRDARTLAEQSGSRRLAFDIAQHDVNAAQSKGDLKVAMDHLANLESLVVVNGTPAQRAGYARLTARISVDHVPGRRRWRARPRPLHRARSSPRAGFDRGRSGSPLAKPPLQR